MLIEDLHTELDRAATEGARPHQTGPDLNVAVAVAGRRVGRRRRARIAAAVAIVGGLSFAATQVVPGEPARPLRSRPANREVRTAARWPGGRPSPFPRTGEPNAGRGASCIYGIDLGANASPRRIAGSCAFEWSSDPAQEAPMSRIDRVRISGRTWLITSGTAPADTASVTAVGADGTPLVASLVHLAYAPMAVFVIRSTGHSITRLQFHLADGRSSQWNDLSTP